MPQLIAYITFVVREYDEAIDFFTQKLKFKIVEDTELSDKKRWVLVAPQTGESALLLAKADSREQKKRIGDQTGGRVFLFLHTADFWHDYNEMKSNGIQFIEKPRNESYGTVAVFFDLYGNKWDLLELKNKKTFSI